MEQPTGTISAIAAVLAVLAIRIITTIAFRISTAHDVSSTANCPLKNRQRRGTCGLEACITQAVQCERKSEIDGGLVVQINSCLCGMVVCLTCAQDSRNVIVARC